MKRVHLSKYIIRAAKLAKQRHSKHSYYDAHGTSQIHDVSAQSKEKRKPDLYNSVIINAKNRTELNGHYRPGKKKKKKKKKD